MYKRADANWELHPAPHVKIETETGPAGDAHWHKDLNQIWHLLPEKVRSIVDNILGRIIVVEPNDERLQGANAVVEGNTCILSKGADPEEILHEVGHILATTIPTQDLEGYYDFANEQRSTGDALAEDFYFMMKGEKPSPFWESWLGLPTEKDEMRSAQINREAANSSLQLVEAVLDELADLVLASNNPQLVVDWGIAKDALKSAQKQDQLSYENLSGPHQYYYKEDLQLPTDRKSPMTQPLQVSKPDVTMRDTVPGGTVD